MEENSVPLIVNHGVQICSEFLWQIYAGLFDRVVRPNLLNWNENDKTLVVFHRNLKLDTLGKYYLLIPFQNFPRDAYPPSLLDGPLSVDIYLNSPPLNPASSPYRVCVCAWVCVGVCVSGMKTTIDLQIIKMIVWPPLGNQKRPLERGVRRHSNSVLSLPPRTAENSLITIQLKNQVKFLEERIEAVETQMVRSEKGNYAIKGFVSLAMRERIVNGKMSQSD